MKPTVRFSVTCRWQHGATGMNQEEEEDSEAGLGVDLQSELVESGL